MKYSNRFRTTFGSVDRDDSYYLEYRTGGDHVYSFLTFDIDTDDTITVHVGKGEEATKISLEELKAFIEEAEDRLRSSMSSWKRSMNID